MIGVRLAEAPCPKCKKIGLHHPPHPHAFGHKNYDVVVCNRKKSCGGRFDAAKYQAWLEKQPQRKDGDE